MIKIISPIVPASSVRLLKTYSTESLINDWKNAFNIDISYEFKGIDKVSLYRCEDSKLDFFTPTSASGSPMLYKALQKFEWFYMANKWEFSEAMKDIVQCNSLLEIGCGQGFFIEQALQKNKFMKVKGIETNKEAVEKAKLNKLPVEHIDLGEIVNRGETFDAVCTFQVLEHITDPRKFLEEIIAVLAPGGVLIMGVPNRDGFLKNQYSLLDMPPHHMTRWNISAFIYLEKLFPIKLIRYSFEPLAKYHIQWYISTYLQLIRKGLPLGPILLPKHWDRTFSEVLRKTGLYHYLRGHSLYVMFKKI